MIDDDPAVRLRRARLSLDGLSVGDALASQFLRARAIPARWLQDREPLPAWVGAVR